MWKESIKDKIEEATKQRAIEKNLKQLANDLLLEESEFCLIFSSSRGKYVSLRFLVMPSKKEKAKIFNKYGVQTWMLIKPIV